LIFRNLISIFRWIRDGIRNRHHGSILSVTWWYWLMSGYGEKTARAAVALLIVLMGFGSFYACTGLSRSASVPAGRGAGFASGLVYSLEVSTLRRPEPQPKSTQDRLVVGLETLLGPLQGTLLALAIRRKYMH